MRANVSQSARETSIQSWAMRDVDQLFFFNYFMYFWLYLVFIVTCGLSLVMASGGYSPISELGLLIVVASLIAEHSL